MPSALPGIALLPGMDGAELVRSAGHLRVFQRDYADLDTGDRECWAELTRHAASPNIFVHDWFMDAALASGEREGPLKLLVVAAEDGRWLGVLPLVSDRKFGRWPVRAWRLWGATNQFLLTPLVLPQSADAFWQAALGYLDARGDGHGAFYCRLLAADDDVSQALVARSRTENRPFYLLEAYDRAARIAHPAGDGGKHVSKKSRRKLVSRLRNLSTRLAEEHGELEFSLHPDGQSPDGWIKAFLDLERAGWKGRGGSALACDDKTEELFRMIVKRACERGVASLATLKAGGHTVAMTSWFVADGQGFGFKMAYDEAFAAYAPGQLLTQRVAELVESEPELDFDTCTAPDSQHCKYLWPDRRELFDCALAIGSPLQRMRFRFVMALRAVCHRMHSLFGGLAAASERSGA